MSRALALSRQSPTTRIIRENPRLIFIFALDQNGLLALKRIVRVTLLAIA